MNIDSCSIQFTSTTHDFNYFCTLHCEQTRASEQNLLLTCHKRANMFAQSFELSREFSLLIRAEQESSLAHAHSFSTLEMSFQKHTINSSKITHHKYKCHECNELFAYESERDNHRRTIHSIRGRYSHLKFLTPVLR